MKRLQRLARFDRRLQRAHSASPQVTAGVDEAGRGPLAGPVVASALILHREILHPAINDSKAMTPRAREKAFLEILPCASIGLGFSDVEEIDRWGIHAATMWAMERAVKRLKYPPRLVLVDGPWTPGICAEKALGVVHGDSKSLLIACASIVAKVVRDRWMAKVHQLLPEYGFLQHKGYGTPQHFKALSRIGPSFAHRLSFQPLSRNFV